MPLQGGGRVNRHAILMVEAVEQVFCRKLRIEHFMGLRRLQQQSRLDPVVVFRGLIIAHHRARRPT